nr:Lrp/AsnC family transcriptional regulator [Allobranchiibius huperziae]
MATEQPHLDTIDRNIIDQLRTDGRMSFADVGKAVGVSESTVRTRFGRLNRQGIIQVVGMSNAVQVGEVEAHLGIHVKHLPVSLVAKELSRIPEVRLVALSLGDYEIMADVRCKDLRHLADLVTERVRRVTGVEGADTLVVLDVMKDTYLWAEFRNPPPGADERVLRPQE